MTRAASTASALAEVLAGRRLVVLVGEGGVGKTSTSAAVAYAMARDGAATAVLTVDPAPRLGDALGLAAIAGDPCPVALPRDARGSLVAMRLDSKRTFDRMVERYAPSPEAAASLLANPLYAAVSERLGGTENYMAFQRLHELVEDGAYWRLVIDTPPAADAAALLAAPERLSGLLETGAMSLLAEPAMVVARAGSALARTALGLVLAAVEKVTGASLQRSVGEFASLFGQLVAGLDDRSRRIQAMLREPGTAFVLVTRPRPVDVERALRFRASLEATGIRVAAVVANRVTPPRRAIEGSGPVPDALQAAVATLEEEMDRLRAAERAALETLRRGLGDPGAPPLVLVEDRDGDVASLDDVAGLANALGLGRTP